jgi:ribosomal protein S18 acetylase RimI-like enzyme
MLEYKIVEIDDSNISTLNELVAESIYEGHLLGKKLMDEWKTGNTFSKKGEKFWAFVIEGEPIAMGGINVDPFIDDEGVGRVRHIYVANKYRRQGLAKEMLHLIIDRAKEYFKTLRLSTRNSIAGEMYKSFGFEFVGEINGKPTYEIKDIRNYEYPKNLVR